MTFLFLVNSMLSLATPTFTGVPNDTVKKIDVYSDVGTNVQNSKVSQVSAFDTSLDGIISGSLKAVQGIGAELENRGIDLPTAKNRVRDALGGSRSAITEISEILERGIMGDMTGTDQGTGYVRGANSMIDSVTMVVNGADRTFNQPGYKNVTGIMGFISDLTNNPLIKTFDLGAEAALIKGVLTEVSQWGIAEIVDETFGAKWNDSTKRYDYTYSDEFRFSVTKRASDSISPSTNLSVIEALMLHGGDTALIADNPSFPLQLLGGYVLPEGCIQGGPYPVDLANPYGPQTKPNYADQGYRLLNILNKLKPNWFYVNRKYSTGDPAEPFATDIVWNMEYLTLTSEAAKLVLATNPDLRDAMLAAQFYRVESGVTMLKTMYPYIVL